jgi:RNA polymerase sigma factor (sigma-70 family)
MIWPSMAGRFSFATSGAPARLVVGVMIPSRERATWLSHQVLPHEPAIRAWLRRRRVDGLETDDIVQETYAVLSGLPSVAHIHSPRAYAFQTAQSVILRHLRRARIVRIDAIGDPALLDAAIEDLSPERHAAARQQLRRAIEVISSLPPKRREAFTLRKMDGLSQRDVARRMGISESTVEKHIGRALQALMCAMKDGGPSDLCESEDCSDRDQQLHAKAENQRAN